MNLSFILGFVVALAVLFAVAMIAMPDLFAKTDHEVLRWFNAAHAVLLNINSKNFNIYAGWLPNAKNKQIEINSLSKYWDIEDRNTLLTTVDWLVKEGHNAKYERNHTDDIVAWDLSRALSIIASGYVAGYVSKPEALDYSLPIAKFAQEKFKSWDDFMASYLRGFEYWSGNSAKPRWEIYERLRKLPKGPYSLDWNLNLSKVW